MQRQIEVRKNTVSFNPLNSLEEALPQEFQKGEISGIYQTIHMLDLTIEALDHEISERKFQENEEDA